MNHRSPFKALAFVVTLLGLLLAATAAGTDCGCGPYGPAGCRPAATYEVTVINGDTAVVQFYPDPEGTSGHCRGSSRMLREDVDSGEVVSIPMRDSPDPNVYYEDPCVPPGTYRYGCEEPFECDYYTVGVAPYYAEHVADYGDAGLDVEQCLADTNLELPIPYGSVVPWLYSDDSVACVGTCEEDDAGGATGTVEHVRTALLLSATLLLVGFLFYRRSRRETCP
jgi:hypothetical protein